MKTESVILTSFWWLDARKIAKVPRKPFWNKCLLESKWTFPSKCIDLLLVRFWACSFGIFVLTSAANQLKLETNRQTLMQLRTKFTGTKGKDVREMMHTYDVNITVPSQDQHSGTIVVSKSTNIQYIEVLGESVTISYKPPRFNLLILSLSLCFFVDLGLSKKCCSRQASLD